VKYIYSFIVVIFLSTALSGETTERVRELVREVQILNLLNEFELSEIQKEEIERSITEIGEIQDRFEKRIGDDAEVLEVGLKKTIEVLGEGKELPPSLKKDISTYTQEIKEFQREMEEDILAIVQRVEKALHPQQIQMLKEYIPCLIPPPGEGRVGQSGTDQGLVKRLEKIRNLPDHIYSKEKKNIIDRAVKKKREHSPLLEEFDEKRERERVRSLLDKVREMSDADFALQKEKLAEEYIEKEIKRDSEKDMYHKIRNYLLDPIVLKYL
jgi:hypothetical protein